MKTIALYRAFRHNGLEYPQNVEHGIIEAQSRERDDDRVRSSSSDTWSATIPERRRGSNLFNRYCRSPFATNRRARRPRRLLSPLLDAQEIVASFVTLQDSMVFTSTVVPFAASNQSYPTGRKLLLRLDLESRDGVVVVVVVVVVARRKWRKISRSPRRRLHGRDERPLFLDRSKFPAKDKGRNLSRTDRDESPTSIRRIFLPSTRENLAM